MKKLWTTERWKRHQQRRQRKAEKRHREAKKHKRGRKIRRRTRRLTAEIAAPSNFSLVENPEETTAFFAEVAGQVRLGRSIFIDLHAITGMTPEAIVALLSLAQKSRVTFGGNVPDDEVLRQMLADSGFFRFMDSAPSDSGRSALFTQNTAFKVEAETAQALVGFVTRNLFGTRRLASGAYEALIEGMSNTHEHAHSRRHPRARGRLKWWAAANFDSSKMVGVFTFVDSGVGIIRSLQLKGVKRAIKKLLGVTSNADVLKEVLAGEVASRTKLPYRGKGLPKIRKSVERGRLRELIIISNDVWANVSKGEFRTLAVPFDGTLLRWELTRDEVVGGREMGNEENN